MVGNPLVAKVGAPDDTGLTNRGGTSEVIAEGTSDGTTIRGTVGTGTLEVTVGGTLDGAKLGVLDGGSA
jgi:hypothetical protein